MIHKRFIVGLLCICVGTFCSRRRTETLADFQQLDNFPRGDEPPFVQTITANELRISLRYMPTERVMLNSYRQYLEDKEKILASSFLNDNEQRASIEELKLSLRLRKEATSRSLYFHLTIAYVDPRKDLVYERMKHGHQAYSEWLQKLMFGLRDTITLQSPACGEVPLDVYHMERSFGLQKSSSFVLVFPARFNDHAVLDPNNEWLQLQITEFGLGTGPLTFRYQLPFKEITYRLEQQTLE